MPVTRLEIDRSGSMNGNPDASFASLEVAAPCGEVTVVEWECEWLDWLRFPCPSRCESILARAELSSSESELGESSPEDDPRKEEVSREGARRSWPVLVTRSSRFDEACLPVVGAGRNGREGV